MTLCNTREVSGQAAGCWAGSHFPGHTIPVPTSAQGRYWQWKPQAQPWPVSTQPLLTPLSLLQPPSKLSTGSDGHGECPPHLITRHWSHSKAWGQSGTPCSAALWCQPLPKHSSDPPASEHRDSKGREALRVMKVPPHEEGDQPWAHSRAEGACPCQTAAHLAPMIPVTRACQHHARLSQGDKTRGLYLLGRARARLPQGSSTFTSY